MTINSLLHESLWFSTSCDLYLCNSFKTEKLWLCSQTMLWLFNFKLQISVSSYDCVSVLQYIRIIKVLKWLWKPLLIILNIIHDILPICVSIWNHCFRNEFIFFPLLLRRCIISFFSLSIRNLLNTWEFLQKEKKEEEKKALSLNFTVKNLSS